MELRPILSTLRRHKTAAALIVLEIALSCAIICNALFLIGGRLERMDRASGIAEDALVRVQLTGIGKDDNAAALTADRPGRAARPARRRRRRRPPTRCRLGNCSWNSSVNLAKDQTQPDAERDHLHGRRAAARHAGPEPGRRPRLHRRRIRRLGRARRAEQQGAAARRRSSPAAWPTSCIRARTRSARRSTAGATSRSAWSASSSTWCGRTNRAATAAHEYSMILPMRVPYTVGGNYLLRVDRSVAPRRGAQGGGRRRCERNSPNRIILDDSTRPSRSCATTTTATTARWRGCWSRCASRCWW